MWVLSPLVVQSKSGQQQPQLPNSLWFLTSGSITVGRPNQKGGTEGKADIIVLGDTSVSSIHATIEINASELREGRPSISITDSSKFGSTVKGKKLVTGQPTALAPDDDIRFGYKWKFRLTWVPLRLHAPLPLASLPPEDLPAKATLCGGTIGPWSEETSVVLTDDGQSATPAVLCALIQGVKVMLPSWLDAIMARAAWKASLPPESDHSAHYVTYQTHQGEQQQLELASWDHSSPGMHTLLGHFVLLVDPQEGALVELAGVLGAEVQYWAPGCASVPAGSPGKHLVWVSPSGSSPAVVEQQQQQGPDAAPASVDLLMASIILRDVGPLLQLVEQHRQQQAAAAGAGGGVAGEEEEATDVTDVSDGGGEEADSGSQEEVMVQPVLPVASQRRILLTQSQATAAAAGQSAAEEPAGAGGTAARPAGGRKGRAATTPGRGTNRGAAVAAAGAAAGHGDGSSSLPPSKRRKAGRDAAAEIPVAPPVGVAGLLSQGQTPMAPPAARSAPPPKPAPAVAPPAAVVGSSAGADPDANGVAFTPLVMLQQHFALEPQPNDNSLDKLRMAVVNFKAFRRKGQEGRQAAAPRAAPGIVIEMSSFDGQDDHPDTEAFLREEEQRMKRMRKADELFNATLAPGTKPKAASRARKG